MGLFDIDIPKLTEKGIDMRYDAFKELREFTCLSMIK